MSELQNRIYLTVSLKSMEKKIPTRRSNQIWMAVSTRSLSNVIEMYFAISLSKRENLEFIFYALTFSRFLTVFIALSAYLVISTLTDFCCRLSFFFFSLLLSSLVYERASIFSGRFLQKGLHCKRFPFRLTFSLVK